MKTNSIYPKFILAILTVLSLAVYALPPSEIENEDIATGAQKILDTQTWIDANKVLMFVANNGSFAFDQGGILAKNDGFYYPFLGINDIQNGTATNTVCFAAGIWIAGVNASTGDTLVSVAEYSADYYPGPMAGGSFTPDARVLPQYRVYKVYSDSQLANPNQDYLEWPVSQGAALNPLGNPEILGDQTLWTVFNDANSAYHTNDASSILGLGVEIQHTVWADSSTGSSPENVSIYAKYKLINKSVNTYNDFFICLWFDPDLGNAGDDLIGCDTLDNIFYCYNDGADSDYGSAPPAFGGKLISGPPMYSFMR